MNSPNPSIPANGPVQGEGRGATADVVVSGREEQFIELLTDLQREITAHQDSFGKVMIRHVRRGLPWLSKSQTMQIYRQLSREGHFEFDHSFITALQLKPTRSQAGVTVITVLTKPYPCPGKCIFCPTDVRMPKSYLHDEPGAMRAERHAFDPYDQTAARIDALERIGHPADKLELLILGGTWSSYRRDYQEWFVKRCLEAMNGVESASLQEAQEVNAAGQRRNVGLVVETRPDHIDKDELRWLRQLGVTKVQIGIQSMDDRILDLNQRGHSVEQTRQAFDLLRLAGFKIHGHWMPNLLGATPQSDLIDFQRLWDDVSIRPDELKIYPCMLVENAELHDYWLRGEYRPYEEEELVQLLAECKTAIPTYTRVSRVIRDIPTTNVVEGMKKSNLREVIQTRMAEQGQKCGCIRCREIRRESYDKDSLEPRLATYRTGSSSELFLSYETPGERIAGFLRLSLPDQNVMRPLDELDGKAVVRELHVYGPAVPIGEESDSESQHSGIGGQLLRDAMDAARAAGFQSMAVISAIGTQQYYTRHGFRPDGLYMSREL